VLRKAFIFRERRFDNCFCFKMPW